MSIKTLSWLLIALLSLAAVLYQFHADHAPTRGNFRPGPFVTYFPGGTVDDFEQRWYSSKLSAMKEPILSERGKRLGYVALRILLLPTWGRPMAIRYEVDGRQRIYRAVMLTGSGGYDPGTIKSDRISVPSQSDIQALLLALQHSGYWSLRPKEDIEGFDGSELIMETIRDGEHRVFVRWTPTYEADRRKLDKLVAFYLAEFDKAGFTPDLIEKE